MIEEGEDEARNRTPEPGTSSDEEGELGRCTVWVPEEVGLPIGRGKLGGKGSRRWRLVKQKLTNWLTDVRGLLSNVGLGVKLR